MGHALVGSISISKEKKSVNQKVQTQKTVRKMDSGNDSATIRGIVGDSYSQRGASVVDGSYAGVQPPTHPL